MTRHTPVSAPESANHVSSPWLLSMAAEGLFGFDENDPRLAAMTALQEVDLRCAEAFHLLEAVRDKVLNHCAGEVDQVAGMLRGVQALLGYTAPAVLAAHTYIADEGAANRPAGRR